MRLRQSSCKSALRVPKREWLGILRGFRAESKCPSCSATPTALYAWTCYECTPVCHPSNILVPNGSYSQNLLRTLTASQVKSSLPESELKLLLSAVKETRVSGWPLRHIARADSRVEGL